MSVLPARTSAPPGRAPAGVVAPARLLCCWCGTTDWRKIFEGRRAGLVRCGSCGCYQTNPPPIQSGAQSAEFYTEYYKTVDTGLLSREGTGHERSSGYWQVLRRHPRLGGTGEICVDIGCGDGHLCGELKAAGWERVIGLEVSSTRLDRARRLYPEVEFQNTLIQNSSIARQSAELITMEAVIEHLPEPLDELITVRRFLAPGGRLVMTTPNMDSGHFRFLGKRWTGMLAPHAHVFLFDQDSIRQLLVRAGFRVEALGSYQTPLFTVPQYAGRLFRGDVKGVVWRAHQEIGAVYGRVINAGPMLYAVGRAP